MEQSSWMDELTRDEVRVSVLGCILRKLARLGALVATSHTQLHQGLKVATNYTV